MDEEDIRKVSVSVYDIDELDQYMWDFGTFVLFGDKEFPLTQGNTHEKYTHMTRGIDADVLSRQDPLFTTQHTVYIRDYSVYASTKFDNATHFISPKNKMYSVVERNVESDLDETLNYIILKICDRRQKEKKAFDEKNIAKNWTPVLLLE